MPKRQPSPRAAGALACRRRPGAAPVRVPAGGGGLEADLADGVFGLRLRESLAGAGRELLQQAGAAEAAHVEVTLGSLNGLRVPVGVQVADRELGVGLREPLAG